jgi:hypothetical protein
VGLIQEKPGRIFYGNLWLKKGSFASDGDDDDEAKYNNYI